MSVLDWKQIAAQLVTPVVCLAIIAVIAGFTYSGLYGGNGLGALRTAEEEEIRLTRDLATLTAERDAIENKVRRMRTNYLDLDLLDERARAVLGYSRPDEIIIYPVWR